MRGASTGDEFTALAAHGNVIPGKKPNFFLIHPAIFHLATGAPTVQSQDWAIDPLSRSQKWQRTRRIEPRVDLGNAVSIRQERPDRNQTNGRRQEPQPSIMLVSGQSRRNCRTIGRTERSTQLTERARGEEDLVDDTAAPWEVSSQRSV